MYFEEEDGLVVLDYKTDKVNNGKELAEKYEVEMPIIAEVNKVLFEGKSASEAVIDLMVRDKKVETPMLPWNNETE